MWAIIRHKKLKVKFEVSIYFLGSSTCPLAHVATVAQDIVLVPKRNRLKILIRHDAYYRIRELKRLLPEVVVKGVPTIQRAVINVIDKDNERGRKGDKELLVEGYGLQKVMTTEGIVGEQATSNHVIETAKVLGIEAARVTIINEIQYTMQSHGMSIDPRHVMLLGDVMSYKVRLWCCSS